MTERREAPKKLPGWVWGGLFGCAVIMSWMGWNKYRPATAAETASLQAAMGGESGYQCIREASRAYAVRLGIRNGERHSFKLEDYEAVAEPSEISDVDRLELQELLTSPRNYRWGIAVGCLPTYAYRLKFLSDSGSVDVWFCPVCETFLFVKNDTPVGDALFSPMATRFTEVARRLFQDDQAIEEAVN